MGTTSRSAPIQRLPQYSAIEKILGAEIHDALLGLKSPQAALSAAAMQIEATLKTGRAKAARQHLASASGF
jgi:multiple sugar transport system substrate-binding protein